MVFFLSEADSGEIKHIQYEYIQYGLLPPLDKESPMEALQEVHLSAHGSAKSLTDKEALQRTKFFSPEISVDR